MVGFSVTQGSSGYRYLKCEFASSLIRKELTHTVAMECWEWARLRATSWIVKCFRKLYNAKIEAGSMKWIATCIIEFHKILYLQTYSPTYYFCGKK
jgi:hypothetical protein